MTDPGTLAALRRLEEAYLASDDPYHGSGFHGGAERWRAEREPILKAIDRDGDILDVGCANGLLLHSLVMWARQRAITLTPHGLDIGPQLVAHARRRLPAYAANLHVGDIWHWQPPQRYDFVYSVCDCAPAGRLAEYARLLLGSVVGHQGRLILGSYATAEGAAQRLEPELSEAGFVITGSAVVGKPARSVFLWMNAGGAA
jgi:SAM-dependent methyltransferase